MVQLRADGWDPPPAFLARGFADRWRGVRPTPGPFGLILAVRSIHGWGVAHPVVFVALDGEGVVIRTGTLRPRRVVLVRRAVWIAEYPFGVPTPRIGATTAVDRLDAWPAA